MDMENIVELFYTIVSHYLVTLGFLTHHVYEDIVLEF